MANIGSSESDRVDFGDHLALNDDQIGKVEKFRRDIRLVETDNEKYALCERMRDQLLGQRQHDATLNLLMITAIDRVMCAECDLFWNQWDNINNINNIGSDDEEDAAKWKRFIGLAFEGSKSLVPLKTVSRIWGRDKVQHYHWADLGESYCKNLCTAARAVSDWDETTTKLNRLIGRRCQQPWRRLVKESVNPVEADDLINLKDWSHQDPFVENNDAAGITLPFAKMFRPDLPHGFGFDRFGLMVREEYAVTWPKTEDDAHVVGNPESATNADTNSPSDSNLERVSLRPRPQRPCYNETSPIGSSQPNHAPSGRIEPANSSEKRCCPPEVPSSILSALNNPSVFSVNLAALGFSYLEILCVHHLRKLSKLITAAKIAHGTIFPITEDESSTQDFQLTDPISLLETLRSGRRRHLSPPDISDGQTFKRPRLDGPDWGAQSRTVEHPVHDQARDDILRQQVLMELRQKLDQNKVVRGSHGEDTAKLICALLQISKPPNTDMTTGDVEALFLSGDEAGVMVESGTLEMPIFTDRQQQFRWSEVNRPIEELFRRMVDLERTVSVQIPSRKATGRSFEPRKLADVRQRFLHRSESDDPWNVLDLANPLPHSILPYFLTGPNCQLLSRVRDMVLMGRSGERTDAAAEKWTHWRDVEEWALLAEGGHNTAPHTDSHGFATWITVQEGLFGFGWLSRPTDQERDEWMADPRQHTGGRWRYVILKPGQTVFFGPGTIHFVFRPRHGQTLALGGHILQWTGIEQWMKVIIDQRRHPDITNEEMRWTASQYVRKIKDLVKMKVKDGGEDEIGGARVILGFLKLATEFKEECR